MVTSAGHGHGGRGTDFERLRAVLRALRAGGSGWSRRSLRPVSGTAAPGAGEGVGGRGEGDGRGDVRASILGPAEGTVAMHGYEMIQEIAERSGGAWKLHAPARCTPPSAAGGRGADRQRVRGREETVLTHRRRPLGGRGRSRGSWRRSSRGVDWEALSEIRQAGFGLMEAFGQVWKTGSKEQREKALACHQRGTQESCT
ncbi:PadR family transcriptional regulator [Streptomyces heliomycini]